MVVVVESCGLNYTFQLIGGQQPPHSAIVEFLGSGDRHDRSYQDLRVLVPFVVAGTNRRDTNTTALQLVPPPPCQHNLYLFPSRQMQSAFETNEPVVYAVAVVCIFLFAVAVLIIYDCIVSIRQHKTETEANRTDAIIEQIFPARIREQLLLSEAFDAIEKKTERKKKTKRWKRRYSNDKGSEFSGESLNQFMLDAADEEARTKAASRAIAELYPETTIMFADVPGFTAVRLCAHRNALKLCSKVYIYI
jgi:hypothetical protein